MLEHVGEIEVQIDRRKFLKAGSGRVRRSENLNDIGLDVAKEYQQKLLIKQAKSHRTARVQCLRSTCIDIVILTFRLSFGAAKPGSKSEYIHTKTVDDDNYPLLIFKFKNRSRGKL